MKTEAYYQCCRRDLLDAIPQGRRYRILEVGAGAGETLLEAKKRGLAEFAVGVDRVRIDDSNQSHPLIDHFIIGDIEQIQLPFEQGYFDAILCGDVLEHLVDPWGLVRRLSGHLVPGGYFIVSMPNVREIKTVFSIVCRGDFRYADSGIMDSTHLRFFCRRNMISLLEQAGLVILQVKSNLDLLGKGKRFMLNKLTFGILGEFLEGEYLLVSRKPPTVSR